MLLLKDIQKSFIEPDGTTRPILGIEEFCVARGEQMVLVGRSGSGTVRRASKKQKKIAERNAHEPSKPRNLCG